MKKMLQNILWGVATMASFGLITENQARHPTRLASLIGTRGMWNDFAHLTMGIAQSIRKARK
jgi:hypothetical protein